MELSKKAVETKGALTVLVDEPEQENDQISGYLGGDEGIFRDDEFLDLTSGPVRGRDMNGEQLISCINDAIHDGSCPVLMQAGFTFVEYRKINDVTKEWVDRILERAAYISSVQGTESYECVFGLFYSVQEKIGDGREEAARQIYRLRTEIGTRMRCRIFILWQSLFKSLDRQKRGLALALHLSGRLHINYPLSGSVILSLYYSDYYTKRRDECRAAIEDCESWIEDDTDSELGEYGRLVSELIQSGEAAEQEIERDFEEIEERYPVSVSDFRKKGFGPLARYERVSSGMDDPRLISAKERYKESKTGEKLKGILFDSLEDYLKEAHYKALCRMADLLKDRSVFREFAMNRGGSRKAGPVETKVLDRIWELTSARTAEREAMLNEKKRQIAKARTMQELSGDYTNIQDFAERDSQMRPDQVGSLRQADLIHLTMVNGDGADLVRMGQLSVGMDHYAYTYPKIAPCEIAVLKICDFISASDCEDFVSTFAKNIG